MRVLPTGTALPAVGPAIPAILAIGSGAATFRHRRSDHHYPAGQSGPLRGHRGKYPGPFGNQNYLIPNGLGFTIPAKRPRPAGNERPMLVRGHRVSLSGSRVNRLRARSLPAAGMMRGDEQVKLPPFPRDGFAPSGHALPDLRPHRRAPARQGQRSADRALPAGAPRSARPPFRVAGPRTSPYPVRGLRGGYLPGRAVQYQGGGGGSR